MALEARFSIGICPKCDSRIQVGDMIAQTGTDVWGHVDCPTTAIDREEAKPPCPECFIIHPEGDCP